MKDVIIILLLVMIATAMLHADKTCIRISDDVVYCTDDDGSDEYIYTFGD